MINNYCEVTTKTAIDLAYAIRGKNTKEKIELPKYQRNLVWGKQKKEKFIESLKLGFPVGAILLHRQGEKNGVINYLIIDGLQRTTTIFDYLDNTTNYNLTTDLQHCKSELDALIAKLKNHLELDSETLADVIQEYIGSELVSGFEEVKGYSAFQLNKFLSSKYSKALNEKALPLDLLNTEYSNILAKLKEKADIHDIKIPVIEYSGPSENLPDIFTRLNTQGTQLNKYQIYAAMWEKSKIEIRNNNIIELIKKKYEDINEKGLSIGNDENLDIIKDFNIFEYLYGLGKYILTLENEKYKTLFKAETSEDDFQDIESYIFVITNYVYQAYEDDQIVKMENLDKFISKINQNSFENAIIHCIEETYSILAPILTFSLNQNKSKNLTFVPISEIQIISLIVSIFKFKFNKQLKLKTIDKTEYSKLKRNILLYYWFDICDGKWDRSTDTQLIETIRNDRYLKDISLKSWDLLMDKYFNEQLSRRHKERTNISKKDILFLKYLYSNIVSAKSEKSKTNYHIDHIIPVSLLKKKAQNLDSALPISAIGNLCLLNEEINKNKGDKTIQEYLSEIPDSDAKKVSKEFEKFIFLKIENLNGLVRKNISEDNLLEFLTSRHKEMKKVFYDSFEIK
ncbi:DUF262 domain-containing protein [Leptospira mtsangambouensis]|uniref:DUF262 domain-containing protein n=1 Tax=Leptospira mtsangambouensis TaxID=2484912 RepID=UPI001EEBA12E|nr:DUF262 domain-containing protein [Leptospira mtsangambouensis]MCG6141369.1 DUF262 domain-containing protein [Leptospira mtsangambouensis]